LKVGELTGREGKFEGSLQFKEKNKYYISVIEFSVILQIKAKTFNPI
jgi:hypothetical protein